MFQIAIHYHHPWPKNKSLKLDRHVSQEIVVSPQQARRKANTFLAAYVTMMATAGEPTLILDKLDKQPVWRVPANLSLPRLGDVSTLGTIDVHAQTSELLPPTEKEIHHMQELAHAIATHFTPQAASTS